MKRKDQFHWMNKTIQRKHGNRFNFRIVMQLLSILNRVLNHILDMPTYFSYSRMYTYCCPVYPNWHITIFCHLVHNNGKWSRTNEVNTNPFTWQYGSTTMVYKTLPLYSDNICHQSWTLTHETRPSRCRMP